MNSYFDTLKYMMILMFIFFIVSIPAMGIYSSYDYLKSQPMYFVTKFSLGNLGKKINYLNSFRRF
jgi:hypothetical protein